MKNVVAIGGSSGIEKGITIEMEKKAIALQF